MSDYFIRKFVPPPDLVGIDFFPTNIGDEQGVVVDENNFQKLLNNSYAIKSQASIDSSNIIGIELDLARVPKKKAEPKPKKASFTVFIAPETPSASLTGFIDTVRKILLPVVKSDIELWSCNGKNYSPREDGVFHIFFFSSSVELAEIAVPKNIWRTTTTCHETARGPSGLDCAIIDEATGYEVAELIGNNLYIHHHLNHSGGVYSELAIFSRLLKEVVKKLSQPKLSLEEEIKLIQQQAETKRQQVRQAYVATCSVFVSQEAVQAKAESEKWDRITKDLERQLDVASRELNDARSKIENYSEFRQNELEKFGLEFDKLLSIPQVLEVKIEGNVIKVFTDILYCVDPRTELKHEIGEFRIEITTNDPRDGIRWFNLARKVDTYWIQANAPHVDGNGKACLGNAKYLFPPLIQNCEFAVVAMMAIQFVESVNVGDGAGQYVNRWPFAKNPPATIKPVIVANKPAETVKNSSWLYRLEQRAARLLSFLD